MISAALGIPTAGYLLMPAKRERQPQWADAGDLSGLQSGSPQQVAFRRLHLDGWKVDVEPASAWIVKQPDGKLIAFAPQCTHLGCAYHWEQQGKEFVCPCHGSKFASDGRGLGGPAPRPLDRYQILVSGSRVWLGPLEPTEPI